MARNHPRRVGRGLVSGSADPAERTVTSMGQRERAADRPETEPRRTGTSLAHPGLEPDIMERDDQEP